MFLLSLMVHAQSRSRMLLIGGIFVLFSDLIYFVFMAAWLNVFLWIGELRLDHDDCRHRRAVVIALINIKDFYWYKQGVSLTIPESAKPGLYARMRNLQVSRVARSHARQHRSPLPSPPTATKPYCRRPHGLYAHPHHGGACHHPTYCTPTSPLYNFIYIFAAAAGDCGRLQHQVRLAQGCLKTKVVRSNWCQV